MLISDLYALYNRYSVITTDSRDCPYGSIFFALKGESFDGNAFAGKALQSGCVYAVVDNVDVAGNSCILDINSSKIDVNARKNVVMLDRCILRIIKVDDVLTTLQQLACLHRKTLGIPVIGITGTNGKTTTKELTAAILSKKYKTLSTEGNLNNHIGVPLTLLKLTHEHEIAVVEMGANHPGEIRDLANIALPDYGLITNVGYAHLEGFGSFEGVLRTKGELYDYIREHEGKVFIDKDNKDLSGIAERLVGITYREDERLDGITYGKTECLDRITYGVDSEGEQPFISGKISQSSRFLSFTWNYAGLQHKVTTQLVGDYNLSNVLAAISIGVHFDVSPEQINDAVANYIPTNNRSQFKKTEHNELIIDAYNANPSSMRAALENFASTPVNKKAVILGDMRELGEKSEELHSEILKLAETSGFEKIMLCGEQFSAIGKKHLCFTSVDIFGEFLEENPLHGYQILIKGSHGVHLERIINKL